MGQDNRALSAAPAGGQQSRTEEEHHARPARRRRLRELVGQAFDDANDERVDVNAEAVVRSLSERSELMDALGCLTKQQRTVLVLRYFEDLSEAQVADLLGCSTGTVKSSASRGVARLREMLTPSTAETEVCEP